MDTLIASLLGRSLASVHHDAETDEWLFDFGGSYVLQVSAPWRLVTASVIAVEHDDHGGQSGRSEAVDAARSVRAVVDDRAVVKATVAGGTADLTIDFGDGIRLEVFNDSAGYEGWILNAPDGQWLVAQGGGRLVSSKSD